MVTPRANIAEPITMPQKPISSPSTIPLTIEKIKNRSIKNLYGLISFYLSVLISSTIRFNSFWSLTRLGWLSGYM